MPPFEHIHEQKEEGKEQRPEDDSHESEEGQADNHSENGDERVDVRHFLLDDEAYQVVELWNDRTAIDCHADGLEPVAGQCHVGGYRKPYQHRAYHRDDAGEAGQEAGKQDVGSTENPVAYRGYSSLYDGKQGNADGIGADNQVDFVDDILRIGVVERQQLMGVLFHPPASYQHEIEHKNQYEYVDDQAADASHDDLPDAGKGWNDVCDGVFAQYVITGLVFDGVRDILERFDKDLRIEIDVLQAVHRQPYHQSERNQKAEDGLCRDEGGGYAALHFPFVGKVHHLLSH